MILNRDLYHTLDSVFVQFFDNYIWDNFRIKQTSLHYQQKNELMIEVSKDKTSCTDCLYMSEASRALTKNELALLAEETVNVRLKRGDKLFTEGFPHSHVIYIREGSVKIHKKGPSGREQILKLARPGTYLGIQCLFGSEINEFSATALEPVHLCYINNESFRLLVESNAVFASQILTFLCKDEIAYFKNFVNLQQKNNSGKLADTLLFFSEEVFKSDTFTLPLSFVDLAALNNTTRESISRQLKDFVRSGIIKLNKRQIKILHKELLRKISENG